MKQLVLPWPPASPFADDHRPTFMAESNATLLAIAGQERRRARGRRQALRVLRWRAVTSSKGGAHGRPSRAQMIVVESLAEVLDR